MGKIVNGLKAIGAWFLGQADVLERVDDQIKEAINVQTKRAFLIGVAVGLLVAAGALKALG
ncbi:hypothetical protein SCACP_30000 [Sporomusa carbonis]|uniref:hypothetical protein n=1 Tax=Sporomusa carbonis TaxID=3076075 RepID=UPI003A660ABF